MYIRIDQCIYVLIRSNPPPRGGFFFGWFPNEESERRGPPLKHGPKKFFFRGGPFSPGFSFGNRPTKKHPPGGGFLSINMYMDLDMYIDMDMYMYMYMCM